MEQDGLSIAVVAKIDRQEPQPASEKKKPAADQAAALAYRFGYHRNAQPVLFHGCGELCNQAVGIGIGIGISVCF